MQKLINILQKKMEKKKRRSLGWFNIKQKEEK